MKLRLSEESAGALLRKIKEEAEDSLESKEDVVDSKAAGEDSKAHGPINKKLFFEGINWTDDQKKAGEYMLDKLDKSKHMSKC